MLDFDWNVRAYDSCDFYFLKAATLAALASIQERMSKTDESSQNRKLALDIIGRDVLESEENSGYVNIYQYDLLLKKLPPSSQGQETLKKLNDLKTKQGSEYL